MTLRIELKGAMVLAAGSAIWIAAACGNSGSNGGSPNSGGSGGSSGSGASGTTGGNANGASGGTTSGGTANGGTANGGTANGGTANGGTENTSGGMDQGGNAGAESTAGAGGGGGAGTDADLSCSGDELPSTAVDPLDIAGEVRGVGVGTLTGVDVEAYAVDGDTLLDSDTSIAGGAYALSLDTGGTPLEAYLFASEDTYLDQYVYPPVPLFVDSPFDIALITPTMRDNIADAGDVDLEADTGLLSALILDCNLEPIAGAVVTTNPAGEVRYLVNGAVSDTATTTDDSGIVVILNLTPGDVEIDAEVAGESLREHTLNVRANVVTTTAVIP
jgi:hypothetical protein